MDDEITSDTYGSALSFWATIFALTAIYSTNKLIIHLFIYLYVTTDLAKDIELLRRRVFDLFKPCTIFSASK